MSSTCRNTLPPSTNATAPRLPRSGTRSSALRINEPMSASGKWRRRRAARAGRAQSRAPSCRRPRRNARSPEDRRRSSDRSAPARSRAAEPGRKAEPAAKGANDSRAAQPFERKSLKKRFEKPDLRANGASRHLPVQADERAGVGLDRVVSRIANQRRRDARQANLRKQPIDILLEELIGSYYSATACGRCP